MKIGDKIKVIRSKGFLSGLPTEWEHPMEMTIVGIDPYPRLISAEGVSGAMFTVRYEDVVSVQERDEEAYKKRFNL